MARKPLWTIEDGVTSSLLQRFMRCRERFRLYAVEGIGEDTGFNKQMEYGTILHEAIDAHGTGNVSSAFQRCERRLHERYPADNEEIKLWTMIAKEQFGHYLLKWDKRDSKKRWTWQERSFHVQHVLPGGWITWLRGKFDAVRITDDELILGETKCKGFIDVEYIQQGLTFDLQTMLYIVALLNLLGIKPTDKQISIQYNLIRRPLSDKFAIRRKKSETTVDFVQRVGEQIALKRDHYFTRSTVQILPADITRFCKMSLNPLLRQLFDWWHSIKADPFNPWSSPLHWRRPYGVFDHYQAEMREDYFDYMTTGSKRGLHRINTVFPELNLGGKSDGDVSKEKEKTTTTSRRRQRD